MRNQNPRNWHGSKHIPLRKNLKRLQKPTNLLGFKLLAFSGVCLQKIISSIMFVVPSPCQVGTDVQDRFMEDFDRWIASSWKVSECYYGVIMSSWLWAYYFDYLELFERIQVFVCHKLWGNHPKIAEVWIAPGFLGSNLIPKFIDPHKELSIVGQFLWHPWILIFTS